MSIPDWFDALVKLATPAVAAVSAFYVYSQYRRAQTWKKNDLALELIARLQNDEELVFACHALDFGAAPLIVPNRYRPLLPQACGDNQAVIQHDVDVMISAISPWLSRSTVADPRKMIYRYCFDRLFSVLDNAGRLLESGQLIESDLYDLKYWLSRIAEYEYPPKDLLGTNVFQPFLAEYGYFNLVRLAGRLDVGDWNVFETYDNSRQSISECLPEAQ